MVLKCPECNTNLKESGDVTYCPGCGLVVDGTIVSKYPAPSEMFDEDSNPIRRVFMNPYSTTSDDYSTQMGIAVGATRRAKYKHKRLKKTSNHFYKYKHGFLSNTKKDIKYYGSMLNATDNIVNDAELIFYQYYIDNKLRGKVINEILMACIAIAYRNMDMITNVMKLSKYIAKDSENKKECNRIRKNITKYMREIEEVVGNFASKKTFDVHDFYHEIIWKIENLEYEDKMMSLNLLSYLKDETSFISGKNRNGIVASCIYITIKHRGKKILLKEIAAKSGVTPVTITNISNKILDLLKSNKKNIIDFEKQ